jgi:hypothetical protein
MVDFTILRDKQFGCAERSLIVGAATETSSKAKNTDVTIHLLSLLSAFGLF